MKYLVTAAATLSFADGSKFEITKGVHSGADFPDSVKSTGLLKLMQSRLTTLKRNSLKQLTLT
jgi:hypothetical protein